MKRKPEEDWERMRADDDIVRPKRNYVTSSTHPAVEREKQFAPSSLHQARRQAKLERLGLSD